MASSREFVDFVVDQASDSGGVRARAMFGEYVVYCREKVVALICDDTLFIKPTEVGRAFAGPLAEGAPYPGAKPCLVVPEDQLDDGERLAELFRITAEHLPTPKPKKKKSKA